MPVICRNHLLVNIKYVARGMPKIRVEYVGIIDGCKMCL